jgi:hypothetical protein
MKKRNRDINIFSLSLMDVISGAMGAFLIIMVILARYYVFDPTTSEQADELRLKLDAAVEGLASIRGGTERIFDELIISERGAATQGLAGGDGVDQIEALTRGIAEDVDRVNAQLETAHLQLNQLEEELQQKSSQLERAQELADKLEGRVPLVVAANWGCDADVDLMVESDRVSAEDGTPGAQFDPRQRVAQNFRGDAANDWSGGAGGEIQLVSEMFSGNRFKVFVNLYDPEAGDSCEVVGYAVGYDNYYADTGRTVLTPAHPFELLGVFTVGDDLGLAYAPATPEQQQAERAAVEARIAATPPPQQKRDD